MEEGLLNGHSRPGAQTLSPHLLPCLDNLPGHGHCILQAFEFFHLLSSMALGEWPERRGRTREQGHIAGEWSRNRTV